MKPTFLNHEKPLLTSMIQVRTPNEFISLARTSMFDGADALGFQIEQFSKEFRTEENYKNMFYFADDKPVYVTCYRGGLNEGMTDDELADTLLLCGKSGGTLMDIMGDYFDKSPDEITRNPSAVDKQKKLIDKMHDNGLEVLMSSHTMRFMGHDEVLSVVSEHQKRGADIAKIVTASNTEEEMLENLKTASLLKKELDIPYLFLSVGPYCKIHRNLGPMLGCCMWLTVPEYNELATKDQPLLRATRQYVDNFDYKPHRT